MKVLTVLLPWTISPCACIIDEGGNLQQEDFPLQVLSLDADSQPLRQPESLFQLPAYKRHGNVFWRDYWTANAALEVRLSQTLIDCRKPL